MSIGFSYRIERSRLNTDFVRMRDDSANFLRVNDPNASSPTFYDFAAEILAGTEHVLKLSNANGAFYHSGVITEVSAKEVIVLNPITMVPPFHGSGDTYEILRRESDGTLTSITSGNVSTYFPLNEKTYGMVFTLLTATGIPREMFLVKQGNNITLDTASGIQNTPQQPVYERVATAEETTRIVTESLFAFDNNKAGFQWYRSNQFIEFYETEEDAQNAEGSLLGQLVALVASLLTPNILDPVFAVSPGSGVVQIGQQVQLDAIGEKGDVSWTLTQNESGATINNSGFYVAGSATGTDIITVRDTAGNTIQLTFTVQDIYSTTFDGEFSWQQT